MTSLYLLSYPPSAHRLEFLIKVALEGRLSSVSHVQSTNICCAPAAEDLTRKKERKLLQLQLWLQKEMEVPQNGTLLDAFMMKCNNRYNLVPATISNGTKEADDPRGISKELRISA